MICERCGTEVPAGSFFCNVCGAEIRIVSDYNLENDIIDSYIGAEETKTPEPPVKRKPKQPDRKELSFRFYRNIAIGVGVAIALILIVVVFIFRYRAARSAEDGSFDYQLAEGISAYEAADYEMAVAHFDKALSLSPDNPEVLRYEALCYESLGEYEAAESIYKSLIALDPSEQSYFEALAALYEGQNEFEKLRDLSGLTEDEAVLSYLATFSVPAPAFSHESGDYDDDLTISILSEPDMILYYTTDGSDPVTNGLVYTGVVRFEGEGHYILKAVAQNSVNLYSELAEAEYVIDYRTPEKPTVNLPSGIYAGQQLLTVEVPEEHTAYYTLDGTEPTTRSFVYESPIVLPAGGQYLVSIVYVSPHGKLGESATFSYIVTELPQ